MSNEEQEEYVYFNEYMLSFHIDIDNLEKLKYLIENDESITKENVKMYEKMILKFLKE